MCICSPKFNNPTGVALRHVSKLLAQLRGSCVAMYAGADLAYSHKVNLSGNFIENFMLLNSILHHQLC